MALACSEILTFPFTFASAESSAENITTCYQQASLLIDKTNSTKQIKSKLYILILIILYSCAKKIDLNFK
jgi:hypothetical protein